MTSNYIQSNQVVLLPAPAAASLTNVINVADSGKILILGVQTAIQTFTLPLPAPGLYYKIIADATIVNAVTISTNPISLFYGNLTNLSTAVAVAGTAIVFVAAKNGATSIVFTATARAGDYVEMVSDGQYWYVNGLSTTALGGGLA